MYIHAESSLSNNPAKSVSKNLPPRPRTWHSIPDYPCYLVKFLIPHFGVYKSALARILLGQFSKNLLTLDVSSWSLSIH